MESQGLPDMIFRSECCAATMIPHGEFMECRACLKRCGTVKYHREDRCIPKDALEASVSEAEAIIREAAKACVWRPIGEYREEMGEVDLWVEDWYGDTGAGPIKRRACYMRRVDGKWERYGGHTLDSAHKVTHFMEIPEGPK